MKEKKNLLCKVIFTLLSIFIVSFIFINSSLDASASTIQSTGVREFANSLIRYLGFGFELSENFVRKCAHFVEYFALSVSLCFMYKFYFIKPKQTFLITLATGFVTACVDETIQLFSDGRSAQFSDVLLDFSAVVTATCLLYIVISKIKNKWGKNNDE